MTRIPKRPYTLPRLALVGVAAIAGAARPLAAQRVERVGDGDAAFDRRLDRLIESGDFSIVARDTTIRRGETVPRTVLVLGATLRLSGTVRGDLVSVDGNVFLRPTARVAGDVVNIGGGLYRTPGAEAGGEVVDRPEARYTAERTPTGYRIVARPTESPLRLDGFLGFREPWYDRVNGLWARWGAEYRLPAFGGVEPALLGGAGYRTEPGRASGEAALRLTRGSGSLSLGAARRSATNEEWIRGSLRNALAFAVAGNDYRNYYEVDEAFAVVEWSRGTPSRRLTARVGGRLEDAESLPTGDPFSLLEDPPYRANPPIDDGTIAGIVAGIGGEWIGESSAVEGRAGVELAGAALGGDFSFGRFVVEGEWAMAALADHRLEIEWYGQGVLPGTGTLPRQRWTFVGGSGTLQTFELAEFRGDRVVMVETDYIIPLPRAFRLPVLGTPDLELLHRVGMAWTEDRQRDLEQNIGARLQYFALYLRVMTNPAKPLDQVDFDIGASWPFDDDRPWRRGG